MTVSHSLPLPEPRSHRWAAWLPLLAAIALGVGLAAFSSAIPHPTPITAPASRFSAERAMQDIAALAQSAHPIGSATIEPVREHIAARLAALGLTVSVRPDVGITVNRHFQDAALAGNIRNITAELPGSDPRLPAVLIMAHYDTMPHSPGAADDTAGVATAIEIANNLKASGPHLRSAIFLLTDGEEAGLLGSSAFFADDPIRRRVGVVLNLEARGDSGRTAMFEMSPNSGPLLARYAAHAPTPSADSFASALYHQMPNDTDLTNAIGRGFVGMNFAFAGDQLAYHTTVATPEHLNVGSVQHMGDQALATAKALVDDPATNLRGPDPVYSDLFGATLVTYPSWAEWLLIVASALLVACQAFVAHRRGLADWGNVARGVGGLALIAAANGLALRLDGRLVSFLLRKATSAHTYFGQFDLLLAGAAVVAIGTSLIIVAGIAGGRWRTVCAGAVLAGVACNLFGGFDALGAGLALGAAAIAAIALRRPNSLSGAWIGGQALVLTFAIVLQIFAPQGAHLLTWPLLVVALTAAILLSRHPSPRLASAIAVLGSGLAIGLAAAQANGFFLAIGATFPMVVTPFAALGALALLPLAWRPDVRPSNLWLGSLTLLGGAGVLAVACVAGMTPTAAKPHMTEAFFLAEPDVGQAYRASTFPVLDSWARATLAADGGALRQTVLDSFFAGPIWLAPSRTAVVNRPDLRLTAYPAPADFHLTLFGRAENGGRSLVFRIRPTQSLTDLDVQGRATKVLLPANQWSQITYYASGPEGVTLDFTAKAHGRLDASVLETRDGWPSSARVPAKPVGVAPFHRSDTTAIGVQSSLAW